MTAGNHAAARRRLRRTLGAGLALVLALTGFIDIAALVVPIYDMQLYDRVLQSQSMDTLTVLSVACAVGLLIFGLLDFLRGACLLAVGDAVGHHLNGPVLDQTIRRAAAGDAKVGPEMVRDLNELQSFMSSGAVTAPLDALFTPVFLVVLAMLHPAFAWLAVVGISSLVLVNLAAEILVRPALLAANDGRAEAGRVLSRSLNDPEVTDGLGMLPAAARRWAAQNGRALMRLQRASSRALGVSGLSRVIRFAVQGGNMAMGALLVLAGTTTPGSLMGANLLVNKTLGPFDSLTRSWRQWMQAHAAWQRIDRLLLTAPEARASQPTAQGECHPGLLADGVTVNTSDGRPLLHGIDFHLQPGTLVVLCGRNGSGKTTLLRVLAGLVPPTCGTVSLDGAPVGGVGYLPQNVSLLEGTLTENIGQFGADRLAETVAAARQAGVHEPIGRLPRGYDMRLSGNGAALSGGMRQRVGLARALCGAPRLLLLDEPDASLDGEGGAALVQALRAECKAGAIAIVISHRPGLRAAADLVLTLQDGTLANPDVTIGTQAVQLATA